jgi:hypothetical protein
VDKQCEIMVARRSRHNRGETLDTCLVFKIYSIASSMWLGSEFRYNHSSVFMIKVKVAGFVKDGDVTSPPSYELYYLSFDSPLSFFITLSFEGE